LRIADPVVVTVERAVAEEDVLDRRLRAEVRARGHLVDLTIAVGLLAVEIPLALDLDVRAVLGLAVLLGGSSGGKSQGGGGHGGDQGGGGEEASAEHGDDPARGLSSRRRGNA
jgi:uncharacterized membrane protein YgcG